MPTWNDKYNATPRQGYNPGYGAREFQGLKGRITDRMSVDHIFGEDETLASLTSGVHKEGSAVVTVFDGNETDTPRATYREANTSEIGRVSFYIDERVTDLKVNTVTQTETAAVREAKIKFIADLIGSGTSISQEIIFDFDKVVNVTYDQDIAGIKIFTDTARVQDSTIEIEKVDEATAYVAVSEPDSLQEVIPLGQLRGIITEAKAHNILDAADAGAYNTIETVDGIDYTLHSISVQSVRAKNIYGVAWG